MWIELILASQNQGKVREFQNLLQTTGITVHSLKEYPMVGKIEETGTTFAENALIKAREVCRATGKAALADDSGLMVDALDGAPGIYSARFAGEEKNDVANNQKLLRLLEGVSETKRTGQFFCAIALVLPDGREYVVEGSCPGKILREARGEKGFGYDPLFFIEEKGKTFAEMSMEEKNAISHRGQANQKAMVLLQQLKQAAE